MSISINVEAAIRGDQKGFAITAQFISNADFAVNNRKKTPIVQAANETENPS